MVSVKSFVSMGITIACASKITYLDRPGVRKLRWHRGHGNAVSVLVWVDTEGDTKAFAGVDTLGDDESGDACEGRLIAPLSVQVWDLNDEAIVMSLSRQLEG